MIGGGGGGTSLLRFDYWGLFIIQHTCWKQSSSEPRPNKQRHLALFLLFFIRPWIKCPRGKMLLFLLCHSFTVVPVVLAELQQYTVSPNGVQSRSILSLWLSWKWRLTVKVHAGRDGCYFSLNSFTADDVLRGVTAAALTAKDES